MNKALPRVVREPLRKRDHSIPVMLAPYATMFVYFVGLPIIVAIFLSFTYFNTVQRPYLIGLSNYISILTQDTVFLRNVLPNTLKFAILVGPLGYVLQFLLAWVLTQVPKWPRTILSLLFYSPSITAGVAMSVIWKIVFSGDQLGYINHLLMNWNLISEPIQFLTSPEYLMPIMVLVTLWAGMGIGFLAMMSGILNIDPELFEAGYIDGVRNRFQEIIYVTVPSMKPQMLFGAVMAIVTAFSAGSIGVELTGTNPTPQYAGQLMVNHIEDYGILQYDMGYAAALSVILLIIIAVFSRVANRLFAERD